MTTPEYYIADTDGDKLYFDYMEGEITNVMLSPDFNQETYSHVEIDQDSQTNDNVSFGATFNNTEYNENMIFFDIGSDQELEGIFNVDDAISLHNQEFKNDNDFLANYWWLSVPLLLGTGVILPHLANSSKGTSSGLPLGSYRPK